MHYDDPTSPEALLLMLAMTALLGFGVGAALLAFAVKAARSGMGPEETPIIVIAAFANLGLIVALAAAVVWATGMLEGPYPPSGYKETITVISGVIVGLHAAAGIYLRMMPRCFAKRVIASAIQLTLLAALAGFGLLLFGTPW